MDLPISIKVLRDFVAIRKTEPPKSGLIEVVRMDQRMMQGVVVAIGSGVLDPGGHQHPIEVKVGEEVVFDKVNAVEVEHKGQKYWIVNELSLRCVLL